MADTNRTSSRPVTLREQLEKEPYTFDFFQAVRRMDCENPDLPPTGASARLIDDHLRFGQEPSLSFAPATIESFDTRNSKKPRLIQRFFGLFGPQGAMPVHITEYVRERIRNHGDQTLRRFIDIFHHRMTAMFYRAWARVRPTVSFDQPKSDRFSDYVGTLFGLGMDSLKNRDALPDLPKRHFAGLMSNQTHNAEGLLAILSGYFRLPVQLDEFIGQWIELPANCRCLMGQSAAALGVNTTVGSHAWDCQQKFRVIFGPLSLDDYCRMLPGGTSKSSSVENAQGAMAAANSSGQSLLEALAVAARSSVKSQSAENANGMIAAGNASGRSLLEALAEAARSSGQSSSVETTQEMVAAANASGQSVLGAPDQAPSAPDESSDVKIANEMIEAADLASRSVLEERSQAAHSSDKSSNAEIIRAMIAAADSSGHSAPEARDQVAHSSGKSLRVEIAKQMIAAAEEANRSAIEAGGQVARSSGNLSDVEIASETIAAADALGRSGPEGRSQVANSTDNSSNAEIARAMIAAATASANASGQSVLESLNHAALSSGKASDVEIAKQMIAAAEASGQSALKAWGQAARSSGVSLDRLMAAVRSYVGDELQWDLQLILKKEETPPLGLGIAGRLGWSNWLLRDPMPRDPDDLVLDAMNAPKEVESVQFAKIRGWSSGILGQTRDGQYIVATINSDGSGVSDIAGEFSAVTTVDPAGIYS